MIYNNIIKLKKYGFYKDLKIEQIYSGILCMDEYFTELFEEKYKIWTNCVYNDKTVAINFLVKDYISTQKTITNNIEHVFFAIDYESNFIAQILISYGFKDVYMNLYTIDTNNECFRIIHLNNDFCFVPIERVELNTFDDEAIAR